MRSSLRGEADGGGRTGENGGDESERPLEPDEMHQPEQLAIDICSNRLIQWICNQKKHIWARLSALRGTLGPVRSFEGGRGCQNRFFKNSIFKNSQMKIFLPPLETDRGVNPLNPCAHLELHAPFYTI